MTTAHAFAWVWLPAATEPVVAGRLDVVGDQLAFTYGRSYLARPGAISLFTPELPLGVGRRLPSPDRETFGCVRDAAPDAWGQRVILSRLAGRLTRDSDTGSLPLLTFLLEAQSNRIGGLDFQAGAADYVPRQAHATLDDMLRAADRLQAGEALPAELEPALLHGTSIGEPPLPEGRGFFSLCRVSGLAKGSSCPQNVDRTDSVGMPGELALLAGELALLAGENGL